MAASFQIMKRLIIYFTLNSFRSDLCLCERNVPQMIRSLLLPDNAIKNFKLLVNVFSVSYCNNQNPKFFILYFVNNSVVTDPDSPGILLTL